MFCHKRFNIRAQTLPDWISRGILSYGSLYGSARNTLVASKRRYRLETENIWRHNAGERSGAGVRLLSSKALSSVPGIRGSIPGRGSE